MRDRARDGGRYPTVVAAVLAVIAVAGVAAAAEARLTQPAVRHIASSTFLLAEQSEIG